MQFMPGNDPDKGAHIYFLPVGISFLKKCILTKTGEEADIALAEDDCILRTGLTSCGLKNPIGSIGIFIITRQCRFFAPGKRKEPGTT